MRLCERSPQCPIPQIANVFLKNRIDAQLVGAIHAQQGVVVFIRPIQAEGGGVGDEEFVEGDVGVDMDHFVAHARPREVVHPGRVWGEELGGTGRYPVGEAVVGFLRGEDLPAHYQEHYVAGKGLLVLLMWRGSGGVGAPGVGAYRTPTCSGRVERSGNVPSMSVNILERGCE